MALSRRCRSFPFLFGGTFIEAGIECRPEMSDEEFPFLFGGTFIEAIMWSDDTRTVELNFPSFSEGLSLRLRLRSRLS